MNFIKNIFVPFGLAVGLSSIGAGTAAAECQTVSQDNEAAVKGNMMDAFQGIDRNGNLLVLRVQSQAALETNSDDTNWEIVLTNAAPSEQASACVVLNGENYQSIDAPKGPKVNELFPHPLSTQPVTEGPGSIIERLKLSGCVPYPTWALYGKMSPLVSRWIGATENGDTVELVTRRDGMFMLLKSTNPPHMLAHPENKPQQVCGIASGTIVHQYDPEAASYAYEPQPL